MFSLFEANAKVAKVYFRVGVKTSNDATFSLKNAGFKLLPDWPFQILPIHLQKCQKVTQPREITQLCKNAQERFVLKEKYASFISIKSHLDN